MFTILERFFRIILEYSRIVVYFLVSSYFWCKVLFLISCNIYIKFLFSIGHVRSIVMHIKCRFFYKSIFYIAWTIKVRYRNSFELSFIFLKWRSFFVIIFHDMNIAPRKLINKSFVFFVNYMHIRTLITYTHETI